MVIGTARPADIDYPLGGSHSPAVQPRHAAPWPAMRRRALGGSVANIESPRSGRIDIGIVPSDVLADAVAGQGPFAARGPHRPARPVRRACRYPTLVAHQGLGIARCGSGGKRIGIGSPGSRRRADMDRVMAALGLTRNDFAEVRELLPQSRTGLFANELDAIVYSVAPPEWPDLRC